MGGTIIELSLPKKTMEFEPLKTLEQLEKIIASKDTNIIFKHNATCPISKSVKRNLQEDGDLLPQNTPVYILDILSHRDVSDATAGTLQVEHESPQLLLLKDGKCVYNQSLYNISAEETAQAIEEINNGNIVK